MDNSNSSRNHLGVNKIGKIIKKNNPLPQSSLDKPVKPVSQPQVYNINKNDFRNIVQQLTGSGSGSGSGSPVRYSHEPVRPPRPLVKSPSERLQRIRPPPLSPMNSNCNSNSNNNNNLARHGQLGQPHAESPISAYMRYLQYSINDPVTQQTQPAGLVPNPRGPSGPPPLQPSPSSQFLLPSPSGFLNLSSPPPLSPNFLFSPGIVGPRSPGISFPLSPNFFPVLSPRWRE